jgi:hypothetical protein
LLLTDTALYFKAASSVITREPQEEIRVPLASVEHASRRNKVEWRSALPGLPSFQVVAGDESYVFQTARSDAWVAAIRSRGPSR